MKFRQDYLMGQKRDHKLGCEKALLMEMMKATLKQVNMLVHSLGQKILMVEMFWTYISRKRY